MGVHQADPEPEELQTLRDSCGTEASAKVKQFSFRYHDSCKLTPFTQMYEEIVQLNRRGMA